MRKDIPWFFFFSFLKSMFLFIWYIIYVLLVIQYHDFFLHNCLNECLLLLSDLLKVRKWWFSIVNLSISGCTWSYCFLFVLFCSFSYSVCPLLFYLSCVYLWSYTFISPNSRNYSKTFAFVFCFFSFPLLHFALA